LLAGVEPPPVAPAMEEALQSLGQEADHQHASMLLVSVRNACHEIIRGCGLEGLTLRRFRADGLLWLCVLLD
jgi:hypothetical protein